MAEVSARAQRFAIRLGGGHVPGFAEVANPPVWASSEGNDRAQLAKVVALLASRSAIDTELNGARLAALADAVGEACFDSICEANVLDLTIGDYPSALPRPGDLERQGAALLATASERPVLAGLAALAAEICRQADMEPAFQEAGQ